MMFTEYVSLAWRGALAPPLPAIARRDCAGPAGVCTGQSAQPIGRVTFAATTLR
jgi:hypothetical protein